MKVILVGSEYAGKSTLAEKISEWMVNVLGPEPSGPPHYAWHDHYQMPDVAHHEMTDDERQQVLALSPRMKEAYQRNNIAYHTPNGPSEADYLVIGLHVDDAVYAPLYFGYGGEGEYGDRTALSQSVERNIATHAPDTVIVLVKATPGVILKRMRAAPHPNAILQEKDVELVVERFQEEFNRALMRRRITLDTSTATVDETLAEFVERYQHHISDADRRRILLHREWQSANPFGTIA